VTRGDPSSGKPARRSRRAFHVVPVDVVPVGAAGRGNGWAGMNRRVKWGIMKGENGRQPLVLQVFSDFGDLL
jgi:hypothetical protein